MSMAITVPSGLAGDHTSAPASSKKLTAARASATLRTCGRTTPSAPSSSASRTRARVASSPSCSMDGMRTSRVLRPTAPGERRPVAMASTAAGS